MTPAPPPSLSPLHRPPPTFLEACRLALGPAAGGAVCGFGLFAGLSVAVAYASARDVEVLPLLTVSATAAAGVGLLVFSVCVLQRLRSLLDRGFHGAALTATWFGFLMLLVLFWGLGRDAAKWFHDVPALVAARNAELAGRVQRMHEFITDEMEEVDRQMEAELAAAASEDEKKEIRNFYEQRIKPRKRADLEATAQELANAQRDIRPNTGAPALVGHFLTAGPSTDPQDAGIYPALLGSIFVSLIAVLVAVPLGVAAAVYLEEYRRSAWLGRIIQINIRNLAGVPSVVYGILGVFLFVELIFKRWEGELYTPALLQMLLGTETAERFMGAVFGHDIAARNVLGGGLTLALLTLPVIIVSSQEALRAVPVSIRHGALALGATRWQVIWHQVLPQARGGILTGVILALSRALGEAAPLVFFGALLFVNHDPALFSRFTVLPMQIFGWVDRPADIWRANAAMASIVLVLTLLLLNAAAIYLRYRAQRFSR